MQRSNHNIIKLKKAFENIIISKEKLSKTHKNSARNVKWAGITSKPSKDMDFFFQTHKNTISHSFGSLGACQKTEMGWENE
jgi:hypothetical protein